MRPRLGFDPVLQRTMSLRAPSPSISFDGIGPATRTTNANPPDANAAIGPQHVLEVTNSLLAVFDKSGALLYGPAATSTIWQGFGGLCGRVDRGDPVALYDRLADRWVVIHMAWDNAASAGSQCVAVSTSPDPLGAWSRYEFRFPSMNDAGKIGLWPDAYVFTTMLFDDGHARVCALDRIRMLAGSEASQQCFVVPAEEEQPIPADLDGARPPAAGAPAWLLSRPFVEALGIYRLHVDWQQPSASSLSPRATVPVAHWDSPDCAQCIPQPSTGQHLIAAVGGLGQRIVYRNLGDHEALLVSHAVDAGNGIVGIRWYELRPDASESLAVFQQGTFAADANHRWMPGAAMDGAGDIAIGYSVASESLHPSIRYAARLAGDPPRSPDARRDFPLRVGSVADLEPEMGRLLVDADRSRGRLHLLVHGGVSERGKSGHADLRFQATRVRRGKGPLALRASRVGNGDRRKVSRVSDRHHGFGGCGEHQPVGDGPSARHDRPDRTGKRDRGRIGDIDGRRFRGCPRNAVRDVHHRHQRRIGPRACRRAASGASRRCATARGGCGIAASRACTAGEPVGLRLQLDRGAHADPL